MNDAADRRIPVQQEIASADAFGVQLEAWRMRMENALAARLPDSDAVPSRLHGAMRYSVLGGGKRIRPALMFATAQALGLSEDDVEAAACAIELVHVYSLVHDDLPAMDDDDLRRGKPTCHVVFGEAHAILAGDGLQAEAFNIMAEDGSVAPSLRIEAISLLAEASGWKGMVGGQALDLEGEALASYGLDHLKTIHRLKTGALIRASLEIGAVLAGAEPTQREALREAGSALGLAFQIQDDILDATSDGATLGKRAGKDVGRGKITYPALLGLDGARRALVEATEKALWHLQSLPKPASLATWARYLAVRNT